MAFSAKLPGSNGAEGLCFWVRAYMTGTLQLSLLGALRISAGDGQPIDLPVRKEEALLAYLALEHGHAHSRGSLISLLWPDAPADKARLSLRVNLSNLRKRLQGVDVDALLRVTPLDIQWVADACYLLEFGEN